MYLAASLLDAARRGVRGDLRGTRGRIALLLTTIAWTLLGLIYRRDAIRGAISTFRSVLSGRITK